MSTITPPQALPIQALPLELLKNRDYTLILGRSSVSYQVPNLMENWVQAQSSIQELSRACAALDSDGLTLYVAGENQEAGSAQQEHGFLKYEKVESDRLSQVLENSYPPSQFDIVAVLEEAIAQYFERKAAGQAQPNGEIFLVILDGEPEERKRLARLVVETTQRMDHKDELAIGFVQIGEDSIAQGLFQYLDDDLQAAGAVYDMVHTQKVTTLDMERLSAFLWDVLTD